MSFLFKISIFYLSIDFRVKYDPGMILIHSVRDELFNAHTTKQN